jgi:large subunit ribosomal protein L31e
MADKIILERTYTVPLRKGFLNSPLWRRTERAVTEMKAFLKRHMKSENVKIGKELNDKLWMHGIKNPPHHVKITVTKDEKGVVRAELFGAKKVGEKKADKKEAKKAAVPEAKKEVPAEKKPAKKEVKK